MATKNCSACSDLKENAPEFVLNGVTDDVCTNLQNNLGLSGDSNDCDDLNDANDCLIGNMESEVDAYEVCDWKSFMQAFIPNLWNMLKAIICTICGIWTNITKLWSKVDELECDVDYLYNGATFSIGEDTSGSAYAVAGKGVSFLIPTEGEEHTSDLSLVYVAGGLLRGAGSFKFYNADFTDEAECGNFDKGSTYRKSQDRLGNEYWGTTGQYATGGELICEFRIKKEKYPQIKAFFAGFGQESGGGAFHVRAFVFNEGKYAYGQHGECDSDGTASKDGYDNGHLVPTGWYYIQLRMTYVMQMSASAAGVKYSPYYFMGVRMSRDDVDC